MMRHWKYIGMMLTALTWASCGNEDIPVDEMPEQKVATEEELTSFSNTVDATTRTLLDNQGGTYKFYWTLGDAIWVKRPTLNTYEQSKRSDITDVQRGANFYFVGHFHDDNYPVYYTGRELVNTEAGSPLTRRGMLPNANGKSATQVTITPVQVQFLPNQAAHFAFCGDCATATATRLTDPTPAGYDYEFGEMTHRASYLIFKPHTKTVPENDNCYLMKVKVEEIGSNGEIAGTYEFGDSGLGNLIPDYNQSNSIELYCTTRLSKPLKLVSGEYQYDFDAGDIYNSSIQQRFRLHKDPITANAANMVIKPGTHKLKVTYTVEYNQAQQAYFDGIMKFRVYDIISTYAFVIDTRTYQENHYYTIQHELDLTDLEIVNDKKFTQGSYYMWDAQKGFIEGYKEYTNSTVVPRQNQANTSYYYPSSDYLRRNPTNSSELQAIYDPCKAMPNVNEMSYYIRYGNAYLDNETLWWLEDTEGNYGVTISGNGPYLCTGGVWLKKRDVIEAEGHPFSTDVSADGYDLRVSQPNNGIFREDYVNFGKPDPSVINDYFFLPFLGYYYYTGGTNSDNISGRWQLKMAGAEGMYWTSSAYPAYESGGGAYSLVMFNRTPASGMRYLGLKWRESNYYKNYRAFSLVAGTRPDGTDWFQ